MRCKACNHPLVRLDLEYCPDCTEKVRRIKYSRSIQYDDRLDTDDEFLSHLENLKPAEYE